MKSEANKFLVNRVPLSVRIIVCISYAIFQPCKKELDGTALESSEHLLVMPITYRFSLVVLVWCRKM